MLYHRALQHSLRHEGSFFWLDDEKYILEGTSKDGYAPKAWKYSRPFSVLKIPLNWIRPAKFPVSSLALNKVGSMKSLLTSTNRINPTCLLRYSASDFLSISFSPRRPNWGHRYFKFITEVIHLILPVNIAETRQLWNLCHSEIGPWGMAERCSQSPKPNFGMTSMPLVVNTGTKVRCVISRVRYAKR